MKHDLTLFYHTNTPVNYHCEGDIYKGTIKEVHPDYLLVDCPEISDHLRFEEDFNLHCLTIDSDFCKLKINQLDKEITELKKEIEIINEKERTYNKTKFIKENSSYGAYQKTKGDLLLKYFADEIKDGTVVMEPHDESHIRLIIPNALLSKFREKE